MSSIPVSLQELLGNVSSPFKPVIRIDQERGVIEVITEDTSVFETAEGVFRRSRDGEIVGARFRFNPSQGFNLSVE